jgi:hypothetical protein
LVQDNDMRFAFHIAEVLMLVVFGGDPSAAQPFSFGVKAGVPVADLGYAQYGFHFPVQTVTNRYFIGPTAEVTLPFGFGVEVDAIYRHFRYTTSGARAGASSTARTVGNAWEFPFLAKRRFGKRSVRPYMDAGIAIDWVYGRQTGSETLVTPTLPPVTTVTPLDWSLSADNSVVAGVALGGGLELGAGVLHFSPEIRYTRWFTPHFIGGGGEFGALASQQNQVEVMVGITFGTHK